MGGEVIDIYDDRTYPESAEYYILLYEFRIDLEKYLQESDSAMENLEDIVNFNNNNKETVMPYFGQDIFYQSLNSKSYLKYLWSKFKIKKSYEATLKLLNKYNLDAFKILCV